jgi:hypothetical protein
MQVACDTHVHCYQFDSLPQLLDHAIDNFARLTPQAQTHILFFTDGFVDRTWLKLQDLIASSGQSGEWTMKLNKQSGFVEASKSDKLIYLAPARQVNTAGRLEMLLLGCDKELEDKQPANDLIDQYADDYVLISPWGVGKWLGKRGRVLIDLINYSSKPFFLGDNGGRPFFWPVPHFKFMNLLLKGKKTKWVKKALPVFNGSDPLPVSGEISRVGSYGVTFDFEDDLSLSNVLSFLKAGNVSNFGSPLSLFGFVVGRVKMILR